MAEPLFNELQHEELLRRGIHPRMVAWRWVSLVEVPPISIIITRDEPPTKPPSPTRYRCPIVKSEDDSETVVLPDGRIWRMRK